MTRILGSSGGGKYVKPAPIVRSSPKPQYVKPAPAPAPKPAPVVNVRSGNNPRGTAIVQKAAPPALVTGGNNPRGVSIVKRTYVDNSKPIRIAQPKPASTGATALGLATLVAPKIRGISIHGPSVLGTIAHNALTDARDLVPTTIEGINTFAQAGAHDLMGIATGATHVGPGAVTQPAKQHSELLALADAAWKQSLTHDVITGNFSAALHSLVQHPLYGAMEFAGDLGVAGRLVGAAARSGIVGDKAAEFARLSRDDRQLVPGTPGLKQHGSRNIIVRAGQHARDKITLPEPIERRVVEHYVRRNVNAVRGIDRAMGEAHEQTIIKEQHDAAVGERGPVKSRMPIGRHHIPDDRKEAADVASAQIMGAASRKSVLNDLQEYHDRIDAHLNDPNVTLTKKARATAESNRDNLRTFLDDPNTKAVDEISSSYLKRASQQTDEQVHLGLLSQDQADTAPLHGAVAMGHVPGHDVRIVTADDRLPSERKAAYMHADHDVKLAAKKYHDAEIKAAKMKPAAAKSYLGLFKQHLDEAKAERAPLVQYKNDTVTGIVETTDTRLPGRTPVYAARRVLAPEVRRRLVRAGRDPDDMGYVNMTAPVGKDEMKAQRATRSLARPDAAYHARTAKGVPTGQTRPGAAMLLDSQLQTQRAIDSARGFDLLDATQSIRDSDGKLISSDAAGIQKIKDQLEPTHGPLTIIPRRSANSVNRVDDFVKSGGAFTPSDLTGVTKKERFGLMPTVASNHYLSHLNADKVGSGAWGAVNRAFRNTVLPLSPKWIAGNDIEGLIRSGLVGAGPRDAQIVGKVIKTLRDRGDHMQADTIESIMSGQHYSMANRRNQEALVAGSMEHPDKQALLRNRPGIKQAADAYMHGIVEPIFHFNSRIESGFDRAVLGAHMHHQMLEYGASMLQAAKHEQAWIEKLADGYSDPALVMDAGRFIQKTLGQYSRFGPVAKKFINTIAPFAPWYANALRFVYLTMPLDHPLTSSILLAAGKTVQSEYAAQFASQGNLNDKVGGHRFGALGTSLAVKGGGLVDVSRYMPWGAFSGGPINAATSPLGPQIQGPALAIAAGEDPFGSPLKNASGDVTDKGAQTLIGLNEFFTSLAGPLALAERIGMDRGRTPYSSDTVIDQATKPDSHHGANGILGDVERPLLPFMPTYLHSNDSGAAAAPASGGYSGGSSSGGYSGGSSSGGYSGGSSSKGYTG